MITTRLNVSIIHLIGNTLVFNDGLIEITAVVNGSHLRLVIYSYESEARGFALAPLEVVEEAPMIISLDGVIGLADQLKLIVDEEGTKCIGIIAGAVLGYEYGRAVFLPSSEESSMSPSWYISQPRSFLSQPSLTPSEIPETVLRE